MAFNPVLPPQFSFDGRLFRHREVAYPPAHLRTLRPRLHVLTDRPEWVVPDFARETDGVLMDLAGLSDIEIGESAFYVCFSLHERALPHLERIVRCGGLFAPPPRFDKTPYQYVVGHVLDTYNKTGFTLGDTPLMGLEVHAQICQAVEMTRDLMGDFVEIGVFSGSSALTALNHLTALGIKRRCWLCDTYSGFTYPAAASSSDLIWAGTHLMDADKTIERITRLVSSTGQEARVVPLDICGMDLPAEADRIALANLDVDMYEAIAAGLEKLAPRMVHRGVIIVEDASSVPGLYGAYLALNEFLKSYWGRKFVAVRVATQHLLIRTDP